MPLLVKPFKWMGFRSIPLRFSKCFFHFNSNYLYLLKDKHLRSPNPAEQIKGLPLASYVFASILSSPPSMCHYTLRVLPNALMIRFIFAEDPISEKTWFVPDGFIEPTRHGRGYWLSCRHRVIQSFIEEKKYRKIDRDLSIRMDLADHIITLFSIRIYNQLKALAESQLRLKHEERLNIPLRSGDSLTDNNSVVGAILDFNAINKDVEYPKISPLNNYNSEIEAIPSYPLLKLIEFGVYKLMLSLPLIQSLKPDSLNSSFKVEIFVSKESTPLLLTLYRLSSYLNNK